MGIGWKPGCEKEVEKVITQLSDLIEKNQAWFKMRDHYRAMEPKELPEIQWEWIEGFTIDVINTRRTFSWRSHSMAETTLDGFVFECSIPGVEVKAMFHDMIDNVIYVELTENSLMPKFVGPRPIAVGT